MPSQQPTAQTLARSVFADGPLLPQGRHAIEHGVCAGPHTYRPLRRHANILMASSMHCWSWGPDLAGQQEGGVLGALPNVQRLILQAAADILQLQLQRPHCQRSAQRADLQDTTGVQLRLSSSSCLARTDFSMQAFSLPEVKKAYRTYCKRVADSSTRYRLRQSGLLGQRDANSAAQLTSSSMSRSSPAKRARPPMPARLTLLSLTCRQL